MELIRICRICGDKAYSCNFNGLPSCPSCRVFFYRNAPNAQKLKCRKQNDCEMDFLSRKSCPKCRLDKCFANGMRLHNKKGSTTQNKNSNNENNSTLSNTPQIDVILEQNIRDKLVHFDSIQYIDENIALEDEFNMSLKENLGQEGGTSYETPKEDTSPIINDKFELSSVELNLIEEIQVAMSAFEEESTLPVTGQAQSIVYLSKLSVAYSRRIIKFAKSMPIFQALTQEDQLLLLKPFCFEVAMIRGAFQFNPITKQFIMLADESGQSSVLINQDPFCIKTLNCARSGEQNYSILADLKIALENDMTIRNLITAILLVKPLINSEQNNNIEKVRYHYFVYCHLLRRYLEQKYQNFEQAGEQCTKLLHLIHSDLPLMKENVRKILLEYGVDQVADLIVEILNLKD